MKKKSKLKLIINTLTIAMLLFTFTVFANLIYSYQTSSIPSVFNHSFLIVQTESMEPQIKVDDLVIAKKYPIEKIKVGDDIIFKSLDVHSIAYQKLIVHRVKEIKISEGKIHFTTYGINNPSDDEIPVTADNYIGKVVMTSTPLGHFFQQISKGKNLMIGGVFLLSALIIVVEGNKIIKSLKENKVEEQLLKEQEDARKD